MSVKANQQSQLKSTMCNLADSQRLRGILGSQSGQSLIELALLTPLLLLMVIGVVEMGRYASLDIVIANAARAGAAYGAESTTKAGDFAGIKAAALNDLQNDVPSITCPAGSGSSCVTATFVCGCDTGGTVVPTTETHAACATACNVGSHLIVDVQVTVIGTFNPLFTYPAGGLFGYLKIPSLTLSSTASERVSE
jgi:Flp pilus assembly protein TadG